jgi:hypothetical protein
MATTDTHVTVEQLFEAVFSVRPVPRLYNGCQLPLENSLVTAVTRIGAASRLEREHESRGHCWIPHQATTGEDTADL